MYLEHKYHRWYIHGKKLPMICSNSPCTSHSPQKFIQKSFWSCIPPTKSHKTPLKCHYCFSQKKNQRGNSGRPGLYCKAWGLGGRQGPAVANQWLGATPPGLWHPVWLLYANELWCWWYKIQALSHHGTTALTSADRRGLQDPQWWWIQLFWRFPINIENDGYADDGG